jgi:DNA helicase MCM9
MFAYYLLSVRVLNSNEEHILLHQNHISKFRMVWSEYNKIDRPFACRDEIVRAVCPQLHGMYFVKLALLLTIIGGSASLGGGEGGAVSRRTQSHMLIVGVSASSSYIVR